VVADYIVRRTNVKICPTPQLTSTTTTYTELPILLNDTMQKYLHWYNQIDGILKISIQLDNVRTVQLPPVLACTLNLTVAREKVIFLETTDL
jgi:hypothetical protein